VLIVSDATLMKFGLKSSAFTNAAEVRSDFRRNLREQQVVQPAACAFTSAAYLKEGWDFAVFGK